MCLAEFYAPLDRDGGVFAYIGASVLAGDLPSVHNELIPSLESELPHHQDDALYAQDDLDPIRLFIAQQYYPQTHINDWIVYERVVTDEN